MTLAIYLINLDRATARRDAALAQLSALGLTAEIVPAVDGATLTPAQLAGYDRAGALAKSGRTLSAGEIGCYLSHVDCARRFLASGADHALVLEDDFHADADLPAFLQALAAHLGPRADWDVVNLGNAAKRFATTSAPITSGSTAMCGRAAWPPRPVAVSSMEVTPFSVTPTTPIGSAIIQLQPRSLVRW